MLDRIPILIKRAGGVVVGQELVFGPIGLVVVVAVGGAVRIGQVLSAAAFGVVPLCLS